MYQKQMLSLSQCQEAIHAMVAEFNKDPNRRPVDMAIVDDMGAVLVIALFYTRDIAWGSLGIRATSTEQGLRKALRQQRFANTLRTGEEIGMPHLLRRHNTPQHIDRMLVADNIPTSSLTLMVFHDEYTNRNVLE